MGRCVEKHNQTNGQHQLARPGGAHPVKQGYSKYSRPSAWVGVGCSVILTQEPGAMQEQGLAGVPVAVCSELRVQLIKLPASRLKIKR